MLPQAVICSKSERLSEAQDLAQQLNTPLLDSGQGLSFSGLALLVGDSLQLQKHSLGKPLAVDFEEAGLLRRLNAGRGQPLARACGLHKQRELQILDCTAGLGQDMLTLAAQGARVTPLERNPVLHLLLAEAFGRGAAHPKVHAALQHCDAPQLADAQEVLARPASGPWDVVYLDPMFSGYRRNALPGKSMQLLAELCGKDEDADDLLRLALPKAVRRVVVKRAPRAPLLGGCEPDLQIKGNRMRFDIYLAKADAGQI